MRVILHSDPFCKDDCHAKCLCSCHGPSPAPLPPAPSPKPGETEALLKEAEQVLLQVEGSAFPSERDNPAMWRAWRRMNAFLARLAARRSRG